MVPRCTGLYDRGAAQSYIIEKISTHVWDFLDVLVCSNVVILYILMHTDMKYGPGANIILHKIICMHWCHHAKGIARISGCLYAHFVGRVFGIPSIICRKLHFTWFHDVPVYMIGRQHSPTKGLNHAFRWQFFNKTDWLYNGNRECFPKWLMCPKTNTRRKHKCVLFSFYCYTLSDAVMFLVLHALGLFDHVSDWNDLSLRLRHYNIHDIYRREKPVAS